MAHWKCIWKNIPMRCPICRAAWDGKDILAAADFHHRWGCSSESPDARAPTRPRIEPPVRHPADVAVLCCQHIGPPPEFTPWNARSMHHHNSGDGDTWHCYGCGNTIARANLFLCDEPPDHWCDRHDCLRVFDLHYPTRWGELIYVGDACVVNCGTYVQLMNCPRGSLRGADNQLGYCVFKRCITLNCSQMVMDGELLCVICEHDASGVSSLHRFDSPPAPTSPAVSIASSTHDAPYP